MDLRDHWNQQHHRRRQQLAAELPLERQREWAERLLQLAARQGRLHLMVLAACWKADLGVQRTRGHH